MKNRNNPFKLIGYHGPDLFCDREKETEKLISRVENGVNTTLFSIRRMGKTGLLHHVFSQLELNNQVKTVYVDIFDTQNLLEFTNNFATAILKTYPEKHHIGKKFLKLLKGFNPTIKFDQLNGLPEVSFNYSPELQNHTIQGLFSFLEQQNFTTYVAFDEFQQIVNYPEKNTEAILRTIIQQLSNVHFIFSGSHAHILAQMFNTANRPFFASTSPLYLDRIDKEKYFEFIKSHFELKNKNISDEAISFILNWTKRHTYYTQALCHKAFQISGKNVTIDLVYDACDEILKEEEVVFYQYRNLLTKGQWNLLTAIAREDIVYQPTSSQFLGKYHLGSAASVNRSLNALVDKEMVLKQRFAEEQVQYEIYNCFLSRWLSRKK